jgi:hypothetical protein
MSATWPRVGQALVELCAATGTPAYLAGAVAIENWVQAHARDMSDCDGGSYDASLHTGATA